jgi:hypothetical protein
MLKPTVGIESSLNSPAARTLSSVVLPLFCSPIRVIYPRQRRRSLSGNGWETDLHFGAPEERAEPVDERVPPIPWGHGCELSALVAARACRVAGDEGVLVCLEL